MTAAIAVHYIRSYPFANVETQARQLQGLTNGHGEDWAKAQELGRQIDPTNPLYREGDYGTEDTEPTPLEPLPPDADAETMESLRLQLEQYLNESTRRAYAKVGRPEAA